MSEVPVCLNCGASIYAEDGGLCAKCARDVHGPEPEPRCAPSPLDEARAHADQLIRSAGREHDLRFNPGLLYDVFRVLERHNYARPHDSKEKPNAFDEATWRAMVELVHLVEAFEGKEPRR